jgi:hypothetical protein
MTSVCINSEHEIRVGSKNRIRYYHALIPIEYWDCIAIGEYFAPPPLNLIGPGGVH